MSWTNKRIYKQVSCLNKKKYSLKTAKAIQANGFKKRPDVKVYYYTCKFCGSNHITKKHPIAYKIDVLKRNITLENVVNKGLSLLILGGIVFVVINSIILL